MASTYLNRAFSSGSVGTIATWSFWIKRSLIGSAQFIFQTRDANSNNYRTYFRFGSTDTFDMFAYNSSGTQILDLRTNRVFRDTSAWYHIVIAMNTTISATPSDRIKFYVNGVQETSFGTATYPTHNLDIRKVSSVYTGWGQNIPNNSSFVDGSMSHINFIDGTAYDATAFGSTDSTTGEWQITANPSVTYGTNGYFILKDGNSVTDQSGNGNNFTVGGGTLTKTEDCPSNVFATFQPLDLQASTQTFAEGNLKVTTDSSGWDTIASTIGGTSGKWYFEAKLITLGNYAIIGVIDINDANLNTTSSYYIGASTPDNGYQNNGARPDTGGGFGASYTANDIIGIAIDMDNLKVYFSKNGTFQNSGNPTSGATGTGAQDLTASTTYCFAISGHGSTVWEANFGSPPFAISSGNTDGNDRGNFEYAVPSGYLSLCTANLSEVLG